MTEQDEQRNGGGGGGSHDRADEATATASGGGSAKDEDERRRDEGPSSSSSPPPPSSRGTPKGRNKKHQKPKKDNHDKKNDGNNKFERATKDFFDEIEKATKKMASPVVKTLEKLGSHHGSNKSDSAHDDDDENATEREDEDAAADGGGVTNRSADQLPAVPPDEILKRMDVFLSKKIRGVSVRDYYNVVWSEGGPMTDGDGKGSKGEGEPMAECGGKAEPFFAPWLSQCGKMNVAVGGWEEEASIVNDWDGEGYDRIRVVTFTTRRSGIGPSTADVTQTHRCRMESNDRCIVSISINMKVPFGDCFTVEVRWVASRVGLSDLKIRVGMVINFHKSCLVESKIRTNTTAETKRGQTSLFDRMKDACGSVAKVVDAGASDVQNEEEEEEEDEFGSSTVDSARAQERPSWSISSLLDFILRLIGWNFFVSFLRHLFAGGKLETRSIAAGNAPPPPLLEGGEERRDRGRCDDIVRSVCEAHRKLGKVHEMIHAGRGVGKDGEDAARAGIGRINEELTELVDKLERARKA